MVVIQWYISVLNTSTSISFIANNPLIRRIIGKLTLMQLTLRYNQYRTMHTHKHLIVKCPTTIVAEREARPRVQTCEET